MEAATAPAVDVQATLKRAGISTDPKGYTEDQLARAAEAPADLTGEALRKHIMGNGDGATASKPRAKYSDRVVAIRESAMAFAANGKAIVPPITPVQVKRVLSAVKGGDPYAEGGPLHGLTKKDVAAVARDGGRDVSTRDVGAWKKRHSSLKSEPNRKIVAIAHAMTKVA